MSDLTESEFHERAGKTILQIEQAVETTGADIDFEVAADILTLEFENGSKIIINKQAPARQIWVAARSGGFHYRYDRSTDSWRNEQNGQELWTELSELISRQAGGNIRLEP